ncbi:MAG: patatin-like phospholipase family protein [Bacillota bacterium]
MEFGLALSGGGARGAAHVGILKALLEEGLMPSYVAGTSAGAIVGALFASGYTPEEIEGFFISHGHKVLDYNFRGLAVFAFSLITQGHAKVDGLIRGARLGRLIRDFCADKGVFDIKDVRIPLAITAVDINNGKLVLFVSRMPQSGRDKKALYIDDAALWQAVRASTAVPVVFRPEMVDGMRLVDGGVRNNVPADVLRSMGAKKVLAVNLGYAGQQKNDVDNILEIGVQSIDIMSYQISETLVQNADYLLLPGIFDVSLLEVEKIPRTIERGYRACRQHMQEIKKALNHASGTADFGAAPANVVPFGSLKRQDFLKTNRK